MSKEHFQKALALISEAAGWQLPTVDERGVAHVRLDEGLDLSLTSPDDLFLILHTDLGEAPEPETYEGGEELRDLGKKAAAYARASVSTLSVTNGRLELTARMPLDTDADRLLELVRRFLNEEARWREALDDSSNGSTGNSPFGFSMGAADWFASQNRF